MQRVLSTVVLLGLLLASAAAFAITEHLKLIKSPVYATHVTKLFSPVCGCVTDKAEISFSLRHADSVTVSIVDSSTGKVVDTIASGVSEEARAVTFSWNGRTSSGAVAPEGTYQPQVEIPRWTILMPNKITVDTTAPAVLSASAGGGILIAGGHHSIAIDYAFSDKAHASVYLGGRRVILGRPGQPHAEVKWAGRAGGTALPPGRYVLEVAARDVAGNETPPAGRKPVVVTIRAIALDQTSFRVAAGAHFTVGVRTAAPRYTWTFAGAHGTEKAKVLDLRAPKHRGRYRLVVAAHGQSASATVIVGGKK